jgi:hypothetical protein
MVKIYILVSVYGVRSGVVGWGAVQKGTGSIPDGVIDLILPAALWP